MNTSNTFYPGYSKRFNNDPAFQQMIKFIEENYRICADGPNAMKESVYQKALVGMWKKIQPYIANDVERYIRQGKITFDGFSKKGGCARIFFATDVRDWIERSAGNRIISRWGSNQHGERVQVVRLEMPLRPAWWETRPKRRRRRNG